MLELMVRLECLRISIVKRMLPIVGGKIVSDNQYHAAAAALAIVLSASTFGLGFPGAAALAGLMGSIGFIMVLSVVLAPVGLFLL